MEFGAESLQGLLLPGRHALCSVIWGRAGGGGAGSAMCSRMNCCARVRAHVRAVGVGVTLPPAIAESSLGQALVQPFFTKSFR
eukprot:scaffold39488_cov29-Tisochrysis_lutea.AAC.2